jgi:hypothetical protein
LIELSRAPELLVASRFIGEGFTPASGAVIAAHSFAAAIMVYFAVVGSWRLPGRDRLVVEFSAANLSTPLSR